MSELSERARELSNEFCRWAATEAPMDDLAAEHLALKFEQALMRERRLTMEEARKMIVIVERPAVAMILADDNEFFNWAASEGIKQYRAHIRSLIDEPVATPRGGE